MLEQILYLNNFIFQEQQKYILYLHLNNFRSQHGSW